jgi:hypothetical protein
MALDKDRYDRQIKALLNGPSGEELDSQRRCEYRRKYPHADEDLIQLLMAADDKAGYPPVCIGHARYIMRTSAGNRRPAPTAKDFDDAARTVVREHYRAHPHLKEPVSKKTYDPGDKSPEAVAHMLYHSPEEVENRVMLATLRKSAVEYKAAKLARTADLAYRIAKAHPPVVLEEAPRSMRTNPELAKQFIAALSASSKTQVRHEYHKGHPKLTEAELDLMVAAEKKAGHPVDSLAHAKQVLAEKSSVAPAPKEPVSKKTYDLENSPESVENRVMLATLRKRVERKAIQVATTIAWVADQLGDRELGLWGEAIKDQGTAH